ncbi:MAG: STAS domain-containing protein [Syntrophobacteria bacterium]
MAAKGRMSVKVEKPGGKVVMYLNGRFDGSSACELENALYRVEGGSKKPRLVLDFRRVHKFELFGIALLAKAIRSRRNRFREISLRGIESSTANMLRHFGLMGDASVRISPGPEAQNRSAPVSAAVRRP